MSEQSMIPTPHIEVVDKQTIAKTVLMPGDPLRAEYIANTFLEDAIQFNNVRGMKGFTGTYKGKKISVMGSGMGMPSIGIYSYELFAFYDVENIIRVGSCGSYDEEFDVYDVILADEVWSESSYAKTQSGFEDDVIRGSENILKAMIDASKELGLPARKAKIHSSDVFYRKKFEEFGQIHKDTGCVAVEMESFALFANAQLLGKKAGCILTVSDSLVTGKITTSEERQNAFTNMMTIALNAAIKL